ncbi:MAG: hypothetical protein JW808_02205 [Victivallales bacterium]|nr:hypothetical protein [Victivallales bacterium]
MKDKSSGFLTTPVQMPFTIIELMVVLAIILTLAALLLPTLARSKSSAQSTFCVNNLKNIGLASFQYSQEWERFCACRPDYKSTNLHRWHGRRNSSNNASPYNSNLSPLYPYIKGKFPECPVLRDTVNADHPSEEHGGGGYGYNLYIGSLAYFVDDADSEEACVSGIITKDMKYPDRTVMFADTAMPLDSSGDPVSNPQAGDLGLYSITRAPYIVGNKKDQTTLGHSSPSVHFRHAKLANVAWADGHVEPELMTWTLDAAWREANLGFWGSEDANTLFNPIAN